MVTEKKKRIKSGGLQKGTVNRVTADLRQTLKGFLDGYTAEQMQSDFQTVKPAVRLQIAERLLRFVLPSLSSVQTKLDFSDLSDAQIGDLFQKVIP